MSRKRLKFLLRFTLRKLLLLILAIAVILSVQRWLKTDAGIFFRVTGRSMPRSSSIVSSKTEAWSYYQLKFNTSKAAIDSWIERRTMFWGKARWRKGPISPLIGSPKERIEQMERLERGERKERKERHRDLWHAVLMPRTEDYAFDSPFGLLVVPAAIVVDRATGTVWFGADLESPAILLVPWP